MEIFQKSTEGQTPTLCFYIRSVFCKHLEAFLKNHPSTHIHLLLQLSVSTPQRILWCLASLGLHAAPDCYAPGLTAHQKWPPHRACVCLCTCVCLTQVILALFSQIKMLKTNDEQPNNISLARSAGCDLIRLILTTNDWRGFYMSIFAYLLPVTAQCCLVTF